MKAIQRLCGVTLALFLALQTGMVAAQGTTYPTKPVRFLVGYAPGGGTDITARLIAERLAPALGQPVVVENRPGAGSNIAGDMVVKSPPDGYTLFVSSGALSTNPNLYTNMTFDPLKDLAPVIALTLLPNVIVVNADLPVKNVKELIAYAKANPSKTSCASSSAGSTGHLSCEMFNLQAGTTILHVPYKGSSAAIAAVLSGQPQLTFDQIPATLPHIKSGRLRAIALTGLKRNSNLPDVPTTDESGMPGFHANTWVSLFAPAGTPAAVVARLNGEIQKILQTDEFRARVTAMGMEPLGGSPESLRAMLATDTAKWAKVIKAANISPQ